ncbi:MAG: thioesterase domain-containing protein [Actinomycetes bacterium]
MDSGDPEVGTAPEGARWLVAGARQAPPLLSFHTWSGEVDHDAALATALGDRPVISLLRPDAAVGPVSTEVSGWVAHYLAVLDELPVEPPDWLLSWSFGVVVALEVARALSERGIEVAYVGMIDAIKPLRFSEQFRLLARKVRSIDGWRARLHHVDDRLRIVVAQLRADIKENRGEAARHLGLRSKRAPTTRSATKDTFATAVHASYLAYRPRAADLPVTVFACDRSIEVFGGPSLGWDCYLPAGFGCRRLEGTHRTLFDEEHVASMATAIAQSFEATVRRSSA